MMTLQQGIVTGKVNPEFIVCRSKREMTFSKTPETACVVPAGTELKVHFGKKKDRVYFEFQGSLRAMGLMHAHGALTGFNKPPGIRSLQKYSDDGIAKTPTGQRCEPDGHGSDGSPSWLLVMGLI